MRSLLLTGFCIILQTVVAQSKVAFQVLHADSAFSNNLRIQSLDVMDTDDSIQSSGLLLVHQTGEFISIEGDTIVNIRELDSNLLKSKGMEKCENRQAI